MKHRLFPLYIDLSGKRMVIYGGGVVAARRAATLCQFQPELVVIAPEISAEIEKTGALLCYTRFDPTQLPQADYVLAATNDVAVNHAIATAFRQRGIPVNNASDQADCDFHFPAVALQGPLVVGVNAGGEDHGLVKRTAANIRTLLENME